MEKLIIRKYKEICYALQKCGVELRLVQPITDVTSIAIQASRIWFLKYCIKNNIAELIENNACNLVAKMSNSTHISIYARRFPFLVENTDHKSVKSFLTIDKIIMALTNSSPYICFDDRPYCENDFFMISAFGWENSNEGWDFWNNEYEKMQQILKQKNEKYGSKLTCFFLADTLNDFDLIIKYYEKKHTSINIEEI